MALKPVALPPENLNTLLHDEAPKVAEKLSEITGNPWIAEGKRVYGPTDAWPGRGTMSVNLIRTEDGCRLILSAGHHIQRITCQPLLPMLMEGTPSARYLYLRDFLSRDETIKAGFSPGTLDDPARMARSILKNVITPYDAIYPMIKARVDTTTAGAAARAKAVDILVARFGGGSSHVDPGNGSISLRLADPSIGYEGALRVYDGGAVKFAHMPSFTAEQMIRVLDILKESK